MQHYSCSFNIALISCIHSIRAARVNGLPCCFALFNYSVRVTGGLQVLIRQQSRIVDAGGRGYIQDR